MAQYHKIINNCGLELTWSIHNKKYTFLIFFQPKHQKILIFNETYYLH